MSRNSFAKDAFIRDVQENVKNLYRKTLEEAGQQEIFQAVCYTVKDTIIDDWLPERHLSGKIPKYCIICPWNF